MTRHRTKKIIASGEFNECIRECYTLGWQEEDIHLLLPLHMKILSNIDVMLIVLLMTQSSHG